MPKIKLTQGKICAKKPHQRGDVVDVDEHEARTFIDNGWAIPADKATEEAHAHGKSGGMTAGDSGLVSKPHAK